MNGVDNLRTAFSPFTVKAFSSEAFTITPKCSWFDYAAFVFMNGT